MGMPDTAQSVTAHIYIQHGSLFQADGSLTHTAPAAVQAVSRYTLRAACAAITGNPVFPAGRRRPDLHRAGTPIAVFLSCLWVCCGYACHSRSPHNGGKYRSWLCNFIFFHFCFRLCPRLLVLQHRVQQFGSLCRFLRHIGCIIRYRCFLVLWIFLCFLCISINSFFGLYLIRFLFCSPAGIFLLFLFLTFFGIFAFICFILLLAFFSIFAFICFILLLVCFNTFVFIFFFVFPAFFSIFALICFFVFFCHSFRFSVLIRCPE